MKQLLVISLWGILLQTTTAQSFNTDSLWHQIETTRDKDLRFDMIYKMNLHYQSASLDSNIYAVKRILALGEKLNDPKIKAYATLTMGYPFYRTGDYRKTQEYILKATRIAEQYPDDDLFSRINNFNQLIEIDPQKKDRIHPQSACLHE